MPAPKCCLKPNTFNAFKFGSQLSVENSLLKTSVISEVNKNFGSKNGFDDNTVTPCLTQKLLNIESKKSDIGVYGNNNKTHVGSSFNTGPISEVNKKMPQRMNLMISV